MVKKWNPKEGKPDEIDAGDYAKWVSLIYKETIKNVDIAVAVVKQTEKLKKKRKYQPIPLVISFKTVWQIEETDDKIFNHY